MRKPSTPKKAPKSMPDTQTPIVADAASEAAAAPRTLVEKLEAARKLVAKYEAEIAAEAIKTDIQEGDVVTFGYGRGDKRRVLDGKVVGVKNVEEGTTKGLNIAILSGEGFDATTYRVHVRDVVSNVSADERLPDNALTDSVPVGGDAALGQTTDITAEARSGDQSDPLNAE